MCYEDRCECPKCKKARAAWTPGRGARWRLALVAALLVLALVVGVQPRADAANARCAWLVPHLQWVGLPVSTFTAIAYRESGCARDGVRISDHDDLSTSRFGLNFRGAAMQRHWMRLCSATWTQPGAVLAIDLLCAKAAYDRMGLSPWR